MNDVILAPVITEKTMKDANLGKFTFKVDKRADKSQIKRSVQNKFKVDVVSITTMITKPKKKRTYQRREYKSPSWKKAVVKVKSGQKIALFDLGAEKKK